MSDIPGLDAHDKEDEAVTNPLPLLVDDDEEGREECKLQVRRDRPSPEETAVVRSLEIGIKVADHQQLCPPIVATFVVHQVSCVPDRTSTQVRENRPAAEEDEVVHGC